MNVLFAAIVELTLYIWYRKTKKIWFLITAIVLSVFVAFVVGIHFFGGRVLWIRVVMDLPIPEYLKSILFGW